MKQEILKKYKLNKEDNLLCAYVLDKHDMCENKNFQTNTYFLDLRQQGIVKNISKDFSVKHCFYGGFDDAERKAVEAVKLMVTNDIGMAMNKFNR